MSEIRVILEKMSSSGPEAEPGVEVLAWSAREDCSKNFYIETTLALPNDSDRAHFIDQGNVVSESAWRLTVTASPLVDSGGNAEPREQVRYFHCFLEEVREISEKEGQRTLKVVFAPVTYPLSFARATRSYREKSVIDLFEEGIEKLKSLTSGRVTISLEKHLSRTDYPTWESRVQYRESDWDFLKRTLERDGLYFFFEQKELETVIHLCDSYQEHGSVNKHTEPYVRSDRSVSHVSALGRVIPRYVCVSGYHYLADGLNLYTSVDTGTLTYAAPVISREKTDLSEPHTVFLEGLVTPPGDLIENDVVLADLNYLVLRRAEEIVSAARFIEGESVIPGLSAGSIIEIAGFSDICESGETFFVASVDHVTAYGPDNTPGLSYKNTFKAYRMTSSNEVQFRPARVTERPSIPGFLTGFINEYRYPSLESPSIADRDGLGRFNVVYQFEAFDGTEDSMNVFRMRSIRMGAGSQGGTYSALFDGAEVVVGFYKGDPDQPIIVGSAFNTIDQDPSLVSIDL